MKRLLADRTNGRGYGTMLCPSVCRLYVCNVCIVAKQLTEKLSEEANRVTRPEWQTDRHIAGVAEDMPPNNYNYNYSSIVKADGLKHSSRIRDFQF